jgi:hypothetical protein
MTKTHVPALGISGVDLGARLFEEVLDERQMPIPGGQVQRGLPVVLIMVSVKGRS